MLIPAYNLAIGSNAVDTTIEPQASTLTDLAVMLDMDTPADSLEVVLASLDGLKANLGDWASIALGYADDGGLENVMTGSVVSIEAGLTITRVVVHSLASLLLHAFTDNTYVGRTAGEIVRDLAGKGGVAVERADDGIAFPSYVIDGRRNIYQHMRDLADLSGLDLYINSEGKLVFEKFYGGKKIHVFEYGKHILELQVMRSMPRAGSVEFWGESPGGSRAADAWSWLTKDFKGFSGRAGSGTPKLLVERPSLRTAEAANTASQAAYERVQRRAVRGRLLVQGDPQVRLGDSIRLVGLREDLNRSYQVRSVNHRLNKSGGFTTDIGFRSIEP